jgi:2-phosphoglycerate kinase
MEQRSQRAPWTILFIGGSSATGKSTVAQELGRKFDVTVVDLDLFWMVLQRTVPADLAPALHFFHQESARALSAETLVERYFEVSRFICAAIEDVVLHYSRVRMGAILEGTWLLPDFTIRGDYAGHRVDDVSSVFLLESSKDELRKRLVSREDGWFRSEPETFQHTQLEMHLLYGQRIAIEAASLGLPVVESGALNSLTERTLAAVLGYP